MLQISLRELHNDMILPISQGICFGAINLYGKLFIGDTPPRKYMPKYVKTSKQEK